MKPQDVKERLSEITAKTYDITLEDMLEFDVLSVQLDWEEALPFISAVERILDDPIYTGDVPADYLSTGDDDDD